MKNLKPLAICVLVLVLTLACSFPLFTTVPAPVAEQEPTAGPSVWENVQLPIVWEYRVWGKVYLCEEVNSCIGDVPGGTATLLLEGSLEGKQVEVELNSEGEYLYEFVTESNGFPDPVGMGVFEIPGITDGVFCGYSIVYHYGSESKGEFEARIDLFIYRGNACQPFVPEGPSS